MWDHRGREPPTPIRDCMSTDVKTGPDGGHTGVSVKVVLMGELKRLAGRREVELRLPHGSTIEALGRELGLVCAPAFAQRILTAEGDFQSHVAVFLNGSHLRRNGDAPTYLADGQVELMLMPIYEGGAA